MADACSVVPLAREWEPSAICVEPPETVSVTVEMAYMESEMSLVNLLTASWIARKSPLNSRWKRTLN